MEQLTAAALGLALLVGWCLCAGNETSVSPQPVLLSAIGNQSMYHDQVKFINQFLRNAANATAPDIAETPPDDNNTASNDVQVIPSVFSSVIDTLPVHPRIPRRSQGRASRNNKHRHSTRVYLDQPVRFLLPPLENRIQAFKKSSTVLPLSENPIVVVSTTSEIPTTPYSTEAATEAQRLEVAKVEESSTQSATGSGPQHRRVFIPPPLRYLLPPFFYENYINAQQSTTRPPLIETEPGDWLPVTGNYYADVELQQNENQTTEASTRLAPIIVIETVSEPDDIKSWDQGVYLSVEYTTTGSLSRSKDESVRSPTPNFNNQFTPKVGNQFQFENASKYNEYDTNSDYYSSKTDLYSTDSSSSWPATTQTSSATKPYHNSYTTETSSPTSNTPLSHSTNAHPFLTGPNYEQTLFETGEFHSFVSKNQSQDETVSMMNRPLLSQEVARAGMKITASFKEDKIREDKLSRGKLKYSHFKQFKFQSNNALNHETERSDLLKLQVAETSYYNRRPVKQANSPATQRVDSEAIPGSPGRDYPTLSRPPTGSGFSCHSVNYHRGYVADPSTGCQVFYICVGDGPGEAMLCPNGTLFSQDFLVCDWWYNVDCQPLART